MASTKIGGVVASIALKDDGFRSGLNRAANDLRKMGAESKVGAADLKKLGGALAGTFGGGAFAKISPVVDLVSEVGPKALTAVPALGAVGAAVAGLGAIAIPFYLNWQDEVNKLNKELDETLIRMDEQRNKALLLARSNEDTSATAKRVKATKDAIKDATGETENFTATLAARFAEIDRKTSATSEGIAAKLARDISAVRRQAAEASAVADDPEQIRQRADAEVAKLESAAAIATQAAQAQAAQERRFAGETLVAQGFSAKLDKAASALSALDTETGKLRSSLELTLGTASGLSNIEIFKTNGGIPKAIGAIEKQIEELRKARADAGNADKIDTDRQIEQLQKVLVQTERYRKATEERATLADKLSTLTNSRAKAEEEARNAVSEAIARERNEALLSEAAKNNAATATANALAAQKTKTEEATAKATELGKAWKRIQGDILGAQDIAAGAGASANESRARRATALREEARQAEIEGRFGLADRRNRQADALEKGLRRREQLTPEEAKAKALQVSALQATEQVARLAKAGETSRAQSIAANLRNAGFGSAALDAAVGPEKIAENTARTADSLDAIRETMNQLRETIGLYNE